jgi:hypothetical protein
LTENSDGRFAIAKSWRGRGSALLMSAIFIVLFVAANLALNDLLAGVQRHIGTLEGHFLLAMSSIAIAVLLLTAAMAWIGGQRLSHYGYAGSHKARNFAIGIGFGTFFVAAQLVALGWLGFLTWGPAVLSASLLLPGAICAALFLVVGFTEESLFRGYLLVELSRAISFWPAALLLAGLFGAMHGLKGGGENVIGGLQAMAAAIGSPIRFARPVRCGWRWAAMRAGTLRKASSSACPTAER